MTTATLEIPVRPVYSTRWLNHHPEFIRSSGAGTIRTFYQYSEEEVVGMLRCRVYEGVADAARNDFFGCMELSEKADAARLLTYIEEELSGTSVSELSLKLFPSQYDLVAWQKQRQVLRTHNYTLDGSITHRLLAVTADDRDPLINNDWRTNAINDFSVSQEPLDQFHKISQLIARSGLIQESNGEMKLAEYFIANFPEQTALFAVRDGAKYCGLSICLLAGPGIVYTLYIAQLEEYRDMRPLAALFQFVYEWGELNEVRYIDMGQISIGLQMNIGMIQGTSERWVKKW